MTRDLIDLALGANRVLTYAGYVLLAGTLVFGAWCGRTVEEIPAWSYSRWQEPQR